jgi:AraC family transcriptional regulator
MDWHEKMNAAMNYIEDNLNGNIDIWEAARLACCSEYHFRRMFSFVAGVPVSEYIRRRRMTLAAPELQKTKCTVEEAAKRYGYSSPDAFTRAFQSVHGISPSQVHENRHSLKAWPRMTFYLTIKGGTEMNYRIEDKPSFTIAGIKKRVSIQFEGVNPEIKAMWKSLDEQKMDELKQLSNIQPSGVINASTNFDEGRMDEQGQLDHYIGVATTRNVPEKWHRLDVQAATWAIFSVVGPFPEALQDTWGRIYSEWFPTVNYELTEGPEILSFKDQDQDLSEPEVACEIWIPVKSTE